MPICRVEGGGIAEAWTNPPRAQMCFTLARFSSQPANQAAACKSMHSSYRTSSLYVLWGLEAWPLFYLFQGEGSAQWEFLGYQGLVNKSWSLVTCTQVLLHLAKTSLIVWYLVTNQAIICDWFVLYHYILSGICIHGNLAKKLWLVKLTEISRKFNI